MLFSEPFAEKGDRADILERAGLDARRHEALARIPEREQRIAAERNGPKESGLGIGDRVELLRLQVIAKDVRGAGVIRASEQGPAVRREHEAVRHGAAEIELHDWSRVAPVERICRPENAHLLLPADFAERRDDLRSVRRDIEVVHHRAVGPRHDALPVAIRRRNPHQCADAVQVADAPQRSVRGVERKVANAGVLHQQARATADGVDRHQIAMGVVVGRIEDRVRRGIVSQGRDGVDRRTLDVDDLLDARRAVRAGRDGADMRQHAGIVERRVDLAVGRIVVGAGHRAQGPRRHVAVGGDGIRAYRREIAALEVALVLLPRRPRLLDRRAEHVRELR